MKKILLQLDSDKVASAFDAIVAYDSGVDVVQSYGGITPPDIRGLILGAIFTRGIRDLNTLAVWIGGSNVEAGEQLLEEVRRAFFGPFRISLMLDSNGCNTTASTAIAMLARQTEVSGKRALVIGNGPVGLRAAILLADEGCQVTLSAIPPQFFADRYNPEWAQRSSHSGLRAAAAHGNFRVINAESFEDLESPIAQSEIVVAAGPAGLQLIPRNSWIEMPILKWILDFNLTGPSGVDGIKPGDDFADYNGKKALGALAIGNLKMKVHKACLAELFEKTDLVLDAQGIYQIAKKILSC